MSQNQKDIGTEVERTISQQPSIFEKGKQTAKNIFYGLLFTGIGLSATSCGNDLKLASEDRGNVYFNEDATEIKYEKKVGKTKKTFYLQGPGAENNKVNFNEYDLTKLKIDPRGPFNETTYKASNDHFVDNNQIEIHEKVIKEELSNKKYFNLKNH